MYSERSPNRQTLLRQIKRHLAQEARSESEKEMEGRRDRMMKKVRLVGEGREDGEER